MILDQIVAVKREEVEGERSLLPLAELRALIYDLPPCRPFRKAITRVGAVPRLIAEIKGASPSRGVIREGFDPAEVAVAYQSGGAAAISVLTDRTFFHGSQDYLAVVRPMVKLPLLRKDFIIDPYQIYQTRLLGADALLLIAALLDSGQLVDWLSLAAELGLEALVEIHNRDELERVLDTGASLIGINNRDLTTFRVDTTTTLKLWPLIPPGRVVVAESGIRGQREWELLSGCGVDAILVGEALMSAPEPEQAVRDLATGYGKEADGSGNGIAGPP